jgi:hypothetical protein
MPTTPVAASKAKSTKGRRRVSLVAMVAAMAALGACTAGPINVGTIPISGTSIMNVNVQACAPRAGALLITTDYHEVDADRVQLEISQWAPTAARLPISTWAKEGRHWEFTTPPVDAGDCFHFFINTVSMCCDPVEPPWTFGFDYSIEYLD